MPFFTDEYTPHKYEDIFFHPDIYARLKLMSKDNSIPHIIFYGPPGSGKKTMTSVFLHMLYGDSVNKLYNNKYNITGSGNKVREEIIKSSNHHIIINPTDTNFDRYIIHDVIKSYAKAKTIAHVTDPNSKFKTIQISNLEKLSHSAQTSLRRMIEVNARTCRFIMWCENIDNVIDPLKSRCVCIRVPRPSNHRIFAYLVYIALLKKNNPKLIDVHNITVRAQGNIKKALWCLQLYIIGCDYDTSYEISIDRLVNLILNCDIKKIEVIRDIFFNIMITNISGITVIKDISYKLLKCDMLTKNCKINIAIKVSEIDYNMIRGRRTIIHFDTFIIHVMNIIQKSTQNKVKYIVKKNKT
jgi:replication factor C subunit 3/5